MLTSVCSENFSRDTPVVCCGFLLGIMNFEVLEDIAVHALVRSGKRRADGRAEKNVRCMARRYEEEGGNEEAYDVKVDMSNIYLVYAY